MSLLVKNIKITSESLKRLSYFIKIEEYQLATFLVLCKRFQPTTVFDIGANVGFYTLITNKYFPTLNFVAFEPTPETFNQLQSNVNDNMLSNTVHIFNTALSLSNGIVEFMDFGDCSGKNSIIQTSIHGASGVKQTLKVQSEALDNLYHLSGCRLLLKLDTEGHEFNVLKGGEGLFKNNLCVLQMETGHGNKKNQADDLIREFGYLHIFSLGPDQYYTNDLTFADVANKFSIQQASANLIINHRWNIETEVANW